MTEDEIRRGVINATQQDKRCFWFKRVITDLDDNLGDSSSGKFLDKTWGNPSTIDKNAQDLLNKLREKDLPEALPNNNVIQYDVKWHSNGIDPSTSQEHAQYIEKLCTDFYGTLTDKINHGIEEDRVIDTKDPITNEIFQQGTFCKKKCKLFHGRDEFLTKVKEKVTRDRVAVLFGESGCGKTSLMAKIATEVKKWVNEDSTTVIFRFIGTTPDSSDARSLMRSICQQIVRIDASEDSEEEKVPQVREIQAPLQHYCFNNWSFKLKKTNRRGALEVFRCSEV